jgi:hypothetical protein
MAEKIKKSGKPARSAKVNPPGGDLRLAQGRACRGQFRNADFEIRIRGIEQWAAFDKSATVNSNFQKPRGVYLMNSKLIII